METQKKFEAIRKIFIVFLILILLIMTLLVVISPHHTSQLSIYSDDWDDLSKFKKALEDNKFPISHISSSAIYLREVKSPESTVFIIAGLERKYSLNEVNALSEFIKEGGNVIIADDFGYGNSILENLKISIMENGLFGATDYRVKYRFINKQVVDISYYNHPNYPRYVTDTIPPYEIIMNAPSGLIEQTGTENLFLSYHFLEDEEIITQSSSMSWLDLNGNFSRDAGESAGPFTMIVKIRVPTQIEIFNIFGSRTYSLVLLSDPGMLINEMWGMADNREFALSLVREMLPDGGEVIFDESVHLNENAATKLGNSFYSLIAYIFGNIWSVFIIELILLIILIYLVVKRKPKLLFKRHRHSLNTRMVYFMKRPELDNSDYHWLKWIMLEKIRISYDIPYEIFYSFPLEHQKDLVANAEIFDFLFGIRDDGKESRFMRVDDDIAEKIIAWKPKAVEKG